MTHVIWAIRITVVQGFISSILYSEQIWKLNNNILSTAKLSEEFPGIFRQFCGELSDNFVFSPVKNLEKISKILCVIIIWDSSYVRQNKYVLFS